jgi:hypothetical protein
MQHNAHTNAAISSLNVIEIMSLYFGSCGVTPPSSSVLMNSSFSSSISSILVLSKLSYGVNVFGFFFGIPAPRAIKKAASLVVA